MPTDARISIVVPLYNKANTILRCLSSIIRQSFSEWECIVVDDGSTDDGANRVLAVSDVRIRVHSQVNAGPGAARNAGAALARSPLLAFLDADDEWDQAYLEHQYRVLSHHREIAASVTGHRRLSTGTDAEALFRAHGIAEGVWRLPPALPPEDVKIATDFMHSGSVVVRQPVFWKYGGFYDRERCTYGEDTHLWLQVVSSETMFRTPAAMMSYHVEDSVLGLGRATPPPPWPMLYHPHSLIEACRPDTRETLAAALGHYAVLAAGRLLRQGRWREARTILRLNDPSTKPDSPGYVAARGRLKGLVLKQPYYLLRRAMRHFSVS